MAQGSSNPTSNLTKINGTAVSVNSGVKDAGTQRVILASDQTAVPITDNGGSLTVDGTVGISGTVPVSIASTVTITGALTDTQLRASAVPVSLASVPSHAVTNAGTFAVQVDGSALTALQLIDDTVIADNTAIGTTKLIAVGGTDGTNSQMLSVNTNGHVNIADGGNSITVDGTVGISGTVPVSIATMPSTPVTGTFWQATQPVSLVSVPSHAVTNAGTFAVQAAQSGTWTVQPGNTANTTPWLVKPAESLGTATALAALNSEIIQALNGNLGAAAVITATATPSGIVLTPYASYDGGTNWALTQFFNSANGDAISTLSSFTVGDAYSISAGDGATHVKVRATSWTSGSVTVRLSSSNSQGLVNLKATALHDDPAGSFVIQTGAVASSTAPTAVSANGDAVRLWATTSGALNIADAGGSITVDGTFWQATQPVSIATSVPITDNAGSLTVDAPVATPVFVRLSDGTSAISTLPVSIAASVAVTGPLTDTQLRAAAVPVSLASVPSHAVTNAGTFAVQVDGSALTALQLIDDTVIADNTAIGTTKLIAVGGTDGTNSQMLSVNTNGHVNIADGGNSITVDGTVGISGTVPVSIATMPSTPVTGTFWQATQPVSIATSVPITDNAGSLTVDAPVATPVFVRLSDGTSAISTLPVSIAASVAVTGPLTDTQLRAAAVPVSLASVPSHAVTNAGTFAVQVDGAALTALQLIDDTVIADNTAIGTTKLIAVGGTDGTNSQMLSVNTNGHVNIADGGNSITVDGTVGISGTVPVSIATMPSTPVTGTFWQATQPVSIAAAVAVTGPLTDTQLRATAVPVSGTVTNNSAPLFSGTTYQPTNATTTAYASSLIIKAAAGALYSITGFNSKTTAQFIQIHNTTTLPIDTSVPVLIFYVAGLSNFAFDLNPYGRYFSTGITICNSSTGPTKTIGAADCWFDAQYK